MTLKIPRIHGWMRQKNVYVPGGRFVGVVQVSRPTPGVELIGQYVVAELGRGTGWSQPRDVVLRRMIVQ